MSLATMITAWSSYQSAAWTRYSGRTQTQANRLERQAALLDVQGTQALVMHGTIFMEIIQAQHTGNQKLADFFVQRLAPDAKKAYEQWLAQNPFENRAAPPHPFVPGLYELRGSAQAQQLRMEAANLFREAQKAGSLSGQFLANTVLSAAVLFFAAMTGKFEQRRVRLVTVFLALLLFGFTAFRTVILPTPPSARQAADSGSLSDQSPIIRTN